MATVKTMKSAFESMMFVWGEPLEVKIAAEVFGISKEEAKGYFEELKKEYEEEQRGIRLREINGKYQLITAEENFDYVRAICTPTRGRRLSQAALEVLALIAYKQPVTKSEIDQVRGIKSDRVIEGLLRKELIEEKGRSDAIGRPILYGTTDVFLAHFDLKTIKELPSIEEVEDSFAAAPPRSVEEMRQTTFDLQK
jgi:segregation and condensation protein B